MFHESELDQYGHRFPHDRAGNVPVHHDHWRDMEFDHGDMEPYEEGISTDEQKRRIEYLNTEWWPRIKQQVHDEQVRLTNEHGETFTDHWKQIVERQPRNPHGFGIV